MYVLRSTLITVWRWFLQSQSKEHGNGNCRLHALAWLRPAQSSAAIEASARRESKELALEGDKSVLRHWKKLAEFGNRR